MLIHSWRKLLSYLEDDVLQGFSNDEVSRSEILNIVCEMKSFESIDKDNEEYLQSDGVKWASSK
jgi:hypothetical protein